MKRTFLLVAALAVAPVALADRWVQVGTFDTGAYSGVIAHLDTATITGNPSTDGSPTVVVTVRYMRPDGQPFADAAHRQYSQIRETYRLFCGSHRYEDAWTKLTYADGKSEDAAHWDNSRQITQSAILDNVLQTACKSPAAAMATTVAKR
jgi:hypothetical protein